MDKGNADEVNYVDFCDEVDSHEVIFGVGRTHGQSFDYYPRTQPRKVANDIVKLRPDDVEDVIARIRTFCKQQRTRVAEFFRDFDKLRSGYITDSQFRIGLNMAKIVLSGQEFEALLQHFRAPKEGRHVCWKDFSDAIDEVFTKKNLEKAIDTRLDDVRTQTFYGRNDATRDQRSIVQVVLGAFREWLTRNRLDPKSFFQDWDRHKHFKVSPKQFRQTLTNLGFVMSDEEMTAIQSIYGTDNNEIQYLEFINDGTPFKTFEKHMEDLNKTKKDQYIGKERTFVGEKEITDLMFKLKAQVKKDRIRLREFFQDHDPLRKGHIINQKFRGVLHTQKITLTNEEYETLERYYAVPNDSTKVNYIEFNEAIENIFTFKDLEKDPLKRTQEFHAPSILDPKHVLSRDEEEILDGCMQRLGWFVRNKRLLIKPFFQDKDKSKSGFVANTRFRSIFDNMKLQISDEEYKIIFKRFQAKADDEVNYVEFDFVLRSYSGDHDPI